MQKSYTVFFPFFFLLVSLSQNYYHDLTDKSLKNRDAGKILPLFLYWSHWHFSPLPLILVHYWSYSRSGSCMIDHSGILLWKFQFDCFLAFPFSTNPTMIPFTAYTQDVTSIKINLLCIYSYIPIEFSLPFFLTVTFLSVFQFL